MSTRKFFTIDAETYSQACQRLSGDLVYFERTHQWEKDSVQVDVFGGFWSIALADPAPGQVLVQSKRGVRDFAGKHLFFVPPFSVVEWHIARGPFTWFGYLCRNPLPEDLPRRPMAFPWLGNFFKQEREILDEIRALGTGESIGKRETASRVALATKSWMDSHFRSGAMLGDLAQQLGVSQAYISKEFRACYGISPQSYLNKLRAFEGMALLLLEKTKVNEASCLTGYSDPSSFYQHFSREFRAKPSQFQN